MAKPGLQESALIGQLAKEGLVARRWSNGPHAVYAVHDHAYAKVLIVVSGSIEFALTDEQRRIRLGPGERLELPARTAHSAVVGPEGVVCLEAHIESESSKS